MAWQAVGLSNDDMCDKLLDNGVFKFGIIGEAFRKVDRGYFAFGYQPQTNAERLHAYADRPMRVGAVHMSAPHMYHNVLEALDLNSHEGLSLLVIGSGTGYLSCIASLLLGQKALVHGVEVDSNLVEHARRCTNDWYSLASKTDIDLPVHHKRRKNSSPFDSGSRSGNLDKSSGAIPDTSLQLANPSCTCIEYTCGNCFSINANSNNPMFSFPSGYQNPRNGHHMYYDRIYVAAGCPESHWKFFTQFLTPKGIIVVPLDDNGELSCIQANSEGEWAARTISHCRFQPLVRLHEDSLAYQVSHDPDEIQGTPLTAITELPRPQIWSPNNHSYVASPSFVQVVKLIILIISDRKKPVSFASLKASESTYNITAMLRRQVTNSSSTVTSTSSSTGSVESTGKTHPQGDSTRHANSNGCNGMSSSNITLASNGLHKCVVESLPLDLWYEIFSFASRGWFEPVPSIEQLLRQDLAIERDKVRSLQSRQAGAMKHLIAITKERDQFKRALRQLQWDLNHIHHHPLHTTSTGTTVTQHFHNDSDVDDGDDSAGDLEGVDDGDEYFIDDDAIDEDEEFDEEAMDEEGDAYVLLTPLMPPSTTVSNDASDVSGDGMPADIYSSNTDIEPSINNGSSSQQSNGSGAMSVGGGAEVTEDPGHANPGCTYGAVLWNLLSGADDEL